MSDKIDATAFGELSKTYIVGGITVRGKTEWTLNSPDPETPPRFRFGQMVRHRDVPKERYMVIAENGGGVWIMGRLGPSLAHASNLTLEDE